ncbi:MAG: L-lactate dehydrogenase complex protein LldG [Miltoncostaeaceae bacterium]|nr:L-lactate dehydrogenase complex protein LldG [Miltoncostaeaceae bacterium]
MAAALAEQLIAAIERRRGSGERCDAAGAAARVVERIRSWGASRALLADHPLMDALGLPVALASAGIEPVRWPGPRDPRAGGAWRGLLGLESPETACGITVPAFGVAERGTLVLEAGAGHGRAIDVASAYHLALLPAERLVRTLEEALVATFAAGRRPPSAVSLVSGPSRTSDIEKISTLGAHGALALHVLVIGEELSPAT